MTMYECDSFIGEGEMIRCVRLQVWVLNCDCPFCVIWCFDDYFFPFLFEKHTHIWGRGRGWDKGIHSHVNTKIACNN